MPLRGEFIKLQVASFISQSGSHFLTIALAGYVFATSGSIVKSALIFVLSYLPSVFFSAQLGNWIDRKLSKWLLARNELLSILSSVLCGACIVFKAPLALLCAVVGVRSLLLFVARAAGSKWIKLISPENLQAQRIRLFFLSFFLSTAVAGILAGTFLALGSIPVVIAIDVATYALSFAVILWLRDIRAISSKNTFQPSAKGPNLSSTLAEIMANPVIRAHFIAVCLSQAVFQGAYSVLVSYLPIHSFRMGMGGVGPFQIAASIGIILGFGMISLWPQIFQKPEGRWPFVLVLLLGIASLIQCVTADMVPTGLLMFFSMNFAYECIWLFNQSEFFKNSPQESLGRFQFTLSSTASFLMAAFTLCYSALIQWYGVQVGVFTMLLVSLVAWRLISLRPIEKKSILFGVEP